MDPFLNPFSKTNWISSQDTKKYYRPQKMILELDNLTQIQVYGKHCIVSSLYYVHEKY